MRGYFGVIISPVFVVLLLLSSCEKEEIPTGSYTAQLWGVNYNSGSQPHYELNLKLELTEVSENMVIFNDSLKFERSADSIFGTLKISNTEYLIYPYLIGKYQFQKKEFFFSGQYSAAKDTFTNVDGPFEIRKD